MPNIASKLVPTFTGPALDADRLEGQVPVTSGGTGVNSLAQLKQNLNLNNVDNTSDANKPVSTAQAAAISTALTTNLANFDEKLAETEAARDEALSFGNAKVVTYWLEADALTGLTNGAAVVVLATDTGFHPAVTGDIGVIAGQTPNSGYYKYSGGLAKLVRQGDLESSLVKTTSEQVTEDATRAEAFAAAITTVLDNYVSDSIAEGLADTSIPNGTYFPVITADGRHFLVKKINSGTSGTIVEYNTVTAFEEATAIVEAARDEALGYGSAKVVASWTEATALTGLTNGYPVFVLSVDTGTHTAVSGDVGTVSGQTPNAGYYRYSTSLAALVRVANLESSLTKSYRDTTKAYLDAVSTMLNGYIFTTVAEGLGSSEVPAGTFFLVVDASNRYYAVYKDVGNVAGQTIEFATAFSGIESPRVRASYTVLAAESGWVDNQIAMVTSADTGTHVSVAGDVGASGGQTPNRGHYRYSTALGKLVRQGDLESVVSTANKNLTEAYAQTLGTMFDGYIYQTTAEGLADPDVPNGTFFPVITTDNRRYDVYKVNGTTAGQIIEYPTTTYLNNNHTKITDLASTAAGKGLSLVSFSQNASGAANDIDALSKARQIISVLDFIPKSEWGTIAAGTSSYDCATAFNNAIAYAILLGAGTVTVPPGIYNVGSKISITSPMSLVGSWGQYTGGSVRGSRLVFSDTVMSSIGTAIEIASDWVCLRGIAISGVGKVSGSNGVRTVGTSGDYNHAFQMDRCAVFGFETGLNIGSYTDHPTVKSSYLSNNTYGMTIEPNNHHDIHVLDSYLDNNTISGVRILNGATTQNFVGVRTHFGFGQYGIYMDPSSSSGGIAGLTLIGCPFEACSQGMINIHTLGSVNIIGGYWIWTGAPSNPAVKVVGTEYGPITIDVQFQNSNANSPFVFQATSYSKWPVTIRGSLQSISGGAFAQALKSPNLYNTALTPTLPASFAEQTNNLGFDVMVYVSGGTVSQIAIGLTGAFIDTGLTSGSFKVRNGDKIRITYSVAPTWKWVYA